jgi:gluconate 2-dehydrogenase gamma chain
MTEYTASHLPIDRRQLLQQMAILLGVTSLPASALAAPSKRSKRFLTVKQSGLLSAVADTILPATDTPGALSAKVPVRLDGLLSTWASAETRIKVAGALDRIDAAAKAQKSRGFAALSTTDRAAVLRPHDAAALSKVPPPPNAPPANIFAQAAYVVDPGYLKLKELVINLYYYSEIAGTTELIYEHVPGAFEPSIKLTPQSRPYLGVGPF